jgi:hypothetical protein
VSFLFLLFFWFMIRRIEKTNTSKASLLPPRTGAFSNYPGKTENPRPFENYQARATAQSRLPETEKMTAVERRTVPGACGIAVPAPPILPYWLSQSTILLLRGKNVAFSAF